MHTTPLNQYCGQEQRLTCIQMGISFLFQHSLGLDPLVDSLSRLRRFHLCPQPSNCQAEEKINSLLGSSGIESAQTQGTGSMLQAVIYTTPRSLI